jgi:centrosomal protein CEP76
VPEGHTFKAFPI